MKIQGQYNARAEDRSRWVQPHRGSILIIVLVCLSVIVAVIGSMLRSVVIQSRTIERQWPSEQAYWLSVAGRDRALARLRQDPEYRGEQWKCSTNMPGDRPAEVIIRLDEVNGTAVVEVRATVGSEMNDTFRETRRWQIPANSKTEGKKNAEDN